MTLVAAGDPLGNAIRKVQARRALAAHALLHPEPEPTDDAELDPIRASVKAKQEAAIRRFRGETEPEPDADADAEPSPPTVNAAAGTGSKPEPEPPDFDANLRAALGVQNLRP